MGTAHGHGPQVTPAEIEGRIFSLLESRPQSATICPSEVARALAGNEGDWRALMPQVRQVAQGLAERQRLHVTRGGVQVDATSRGGPIRLGRRHVGGDSTEASAQPGRAAPSKLASKAEQKLPE